MASLSLETRFRRHLPTQMAQLTHDPEAILIHTAADLENGDEIKRAAADVLVVKQQEVASRASTGGEGVKRPPQGLGAVSTATSAGETQPALSARLCMSRCDSSYRLFRWSLLAAVAPPLQHL